jgi:Ser/Thr protein kinase RdoA (MazF antagonist)
MIKDRFGTTTHGSVWAGQPECRPARVPVSQNGGVTGSPLSAAETRAAETLLASALGSRTVIRRAETIWGRSHVVRLQLATGRSAVLKRRGEDGQSFGAELAALEYLNGMPEPVAPRLLGADDRTGILLMEDLGPGGSLAGSLLDGDRERAQADLISYAEALGSMHAWSRGRPGELAKLRDHYGPPAPPGPAWRRDAPDGRDPFLGAVASLGLAAEGAAEEIGQLPSMLAGPGYLGLVHGDACPDNVRLLADSARIFDFETSGWGPVALDAAYLLAPFPSCWCFARLPATAAAPALEAYAHAAGIAPGRDWDAAMTAALATWIVSRGPLLTNVLAQDRDWGTTTMRPRILTWLGTFIDAAGRTGVLPRLHAVADALRDQLSRRWPQTVLAGYPALAGPGSATVQAPEWWRPGA